MASDLQMIRNLNDTWNGLSAKEKDKFVRKLLPVLIEDFIANVKNSEKLPPSIRRDLRKSLFKDFYRRRRQLLPQIAHLFEHFPAMTRDFLRYSVEDRRYMLTLNKKELDIFFHGVDAASRYYWPELELASKFARKNSKREQLFMRAQEVYEEKASQSPGKRTITYGMALAEANTMLGAFPKREFQLNFAAISYDFKTWRNREKKAHMARQKRE